MTNPHLLKLVEHTLCCRVTIRLGDRIVFAKCLAAVTIRERGWGGQAITVAGARDASAAPILAVDGGEVTVLGLGIAVVLVSAVVVGAGRAQDKQGEDEEGRGHGGVWSDN